MKYDYSIIGGGIVGLATAYQLLQKKPGSRVLVIEKESKPGMHQTGHNSGVIHSGLYYKPGSLKAENCLNGYRMMLDFCNQHGIRYELCGKVVVATREDEIPYLEKLYQRGLENGLTDNKLISSEEVKAREPHVHSLKGIWVPYTGIIDYTDVCEKLAEQIREKGGEIHTGEKVTGIKANTIITDKSSYDTKLMINCAGLYSDKIAEMQMGRIDTRIIPFRGEYYMLRDEKKYLVKNLVYPVPDPNFPFLGVHFTRMIDGAVEAGPNAVFAFRKEGYHRTSLNLSELWQSITWPGFQKVIRKYWKTGMGEMYRSWSKAAFTKALQQLVPEITSEDLIPAEAGVRAQACDRTGGLLDDFKIYENKEAIHILNAPSPAATSSLSIGLTVAGMALQR